MQPRQVISLPTRILLCMHPNCHGEFYLPLNLDGALVCPNDRTHDVAIYTGPYIIKGEDE